MEEEQADGMLKALKTIAKELEDIGSVAALKNVREHTLFLFEIIPKLVVLNISEDLAKDFINAAYMQLSDSEEILSMGPMTESGYIKVEPFFELYRELVSKREKERK